MAMRNKHSRKTTRASGKRRAPENKDDLDSRKNEEQEFRGDDITHNKKPARRGRPRKSGH